MSRNTCKNISNSSAHIPAKCPNCAHRFSIPSTLSLDRDALSVRYGKSLSTIDRWRKLGDLPPARDFSGSPMWRLDELDAFDDNRRFIDDEEVNQF